jgi:hypothetical protein
MRIGTQVRANSHTHTHTHIHTPSKPFSRLYQAKEIAAKGLERLHVLNRRTLDGIAARVYFYYSWSHEQLGQLADVRRCVLPVV